RIDRGVDEPRLDERLKGQFEMGVEPEPVAQLEQMDGEFEVDEPARPELDVEGSRRRLVMGHFAAHADHIGPETVSTPITIEDFPDDRFEPGFRLCGAKNRPSPKERNMLPGPGLIALIILEAF